MALHEIVAQRAANPCLSALSMIAPQSAFVIFRLSFHHLLVAAAEGPESIEGITGFSYLDSRFKISCVPIARKRIVSSMY